MVHVSHSLAALQADLRGIAVRARPDMVKVVRTAIRDGNRIARDFAKETEGAHGKHYHRAFSAEMNPVASAFGAALISGEYGPDAAKRQGNMSFEGGSRNQPPHDDIARSHDLNGPWFHIAVHELPDKWFW